MPELRNHFKKVVRNSYNYGALALLSFSTLSMFYGCIREMVNYFSKKEIYLVREDKNINQTERYFTPSTLESKTDNN